MLGIKRVLLIAPIVLVFLSNCKQETNQNNNVLQQDAFLDPDTIEEVNSMVNFLTTEQADGGLAYLAIAGKLKGKLLPLSFNATAEYWGQYVCNTPILGPGLTNQCTASNYSCNVRDVYNTKTYELTPDLSMSAPNPCGPALQIERVNATNGSNIYDASVWQIALAVAGYNLKRPDLFETAQNQDLFLQEGYNGGFKTDAYTPEPNRGELRATRIGRTEDFKYGGGPNNTFFPNDERAFFFRMVPISWISPDPFKGTEFEKFIDIQGELPKDADNKFSDGSVKYEKGNVTWLDWKPIAGENAWAFLLGPLQTALLKAKFEKENSNGSGIVPFNSPGIQNAVKVLEAFRRMQAPNGAIYHVAEGSLGNYGAELKDPREVSVENNASALGGLIVLKRILTEQLDDTSQAVYRARIQKALNSVNIIIYGKDVFDGKYPNNYTSDGLINFFSNDAWQTNKFIQGGVACIGGGNDGKNSECSKIGDPRWKPKDENAVDVNTWTIAMLGVPFIDKRNGFGAAHKVWQNIKEWGSYNGKGGELLGVGYSDLDRQQGRGILSGEWTAGAINMVRVMHEQYKTICDTIQCSESEKAQVPDIVKSLEQDQNAMVQGMRLVRSDNYDEAAEFDDVRPSNFKNLIRGKNLSYLYASKRYFIPFGWFANPIPSAASTTWSIMLDFGFNPFTPNGDYSAYDWEENKPSTRIPDDAPPVRDSTVNVVIDNKIDNLNIWMVCFKGKDNVHPCTAQNQDYDVKVAKESKSEAYAVDAGLTIGLFWKRGEFVGLDATCVGKPSELITITWENHAVCSGISK